MPTGTPNFDSKSPLNPKEEILSTIRKRLEKVTDAVGHPIEQGIKETVVMLNAFELPTTQSCEGHIDSHTEEYKPAMAPWVEIYPEEPKQENWFDNNELREKVIAESNGYLNKVTNLLDAFYEGQEISDDVRLTISPIAYGFRVQNSGLESLRDPNDQSQREKAKKYKEEMDRFTKFLKNKFLTDKEETYEDETNEQIFQEYMEDLQLKPEDLHGRILDVGSGSAKFAKYAKENKISSTIFSLEPNGEQIETTKSVKAKVESIPFKNEAFDLVISNGAIPNVLQRSYGENVQIVKERVRNSLFESMRVTKPGGEVRLGRVGIEVDPLDPQFVSREILDSIFDELNKMYGIEVEEIYTPPDVYKHNEAGEPTKLMAKMYLIIIRKPL